MTEGVRRGVTRGYVGALIFATLVVTTALVIASWGVLTLATERVPVATDAVPRWVGPVIVFVALGALAWGSWLQALTLLRGRRTPVPAYFIVQAGAAYLIWCLGGTLGGMSVDETWLSPFAMQLAPVWALTSLAFWAVLARRVFTDRGRPKWPWERAEERRALEEGRDIGDYGAGGGPNRGPRVDPAYGWPDLGDDGNGLNGDNRDGSGNEDDGRPGAK